MTKKYASNRCALGICDRCGLTCKLQELRCERIKGKKQNLLVCDDCFDPDHPQNYFGEKTPVDAEALRDPRPDTDAGRTLTGTLVYPPVNGVA
jgi:hypothetical protein